MSTISHCRPYCNKLLKALARTTPLIGNLEAIQAIKERIPCLLCFCDKPMKSEGFFLIPGRQFFLRFSLSFLPYV